MTIFTPVISRELIVAARRRETYSARVWGSCFALLLMLWVFFVASAHLPTAERGKEVFQTLSGLAFGYALLVGAKATADCVSEEKREGTLGLLFLTDLRGWEVIFGKMLASSLSAFYGLVAILPMLSLALLVGGTSLGELARVAVVLLNTIFFSLAAGVFVSTFSRNERNAMVATVGIVTGFTCIPYALGYYFTYNMGTATSFETAFLIPSPLYAYDLAISRVGKYSLVWNLLGESILISHLVAWLFLLIPSLFLHRVSHDTESGPWRTRWLQWKQIWIYGKEIRRRQNRAKLLDHNPYLWLAARDRLKSKYIWIFLGSVALMWFMLYPKFSEFLLEWGSSAVVMLIVHTFIRIWFASEVCSRIVEDRRSLAFELLLTSPLTVAQLIKGQNMALRRVFLKPVIVVISLDLLLFIASFRTNLWLSNRTGASFLFLGAMLILVLDLLALRWVSAWYSLHAKSSSRALLASAGRVLGLPTLIFWGGLVAVGLSSLMMPELFTLANGVIIWFTIGAAFDLYFGLRCRFRFRKELAEIVSSPPGPRAKTISSPAQKTPEKIRTFTSRWKPALALLAVLLFIGYAVQSARKTALKKQIKEELAALDQQGIPTKLAAIAPWVGMLSPEKNGAFGIQDAFGGVSLKNSDFAKIPSATNQLAPKEITRMAEVVARNEQSLRMLHSALQLKEARFIFDYSPGFQLLLPHLSTIRSFQTLLAFQIVLSSDRANPAQAISSLKDFLHLHRLLQEEPLFVSQLVRLTGLQIGCSLTERLLRENSLSASQLDELSKALAAACETDTRPLERSLIVEQASGLEAFAMNPQELSWFLGGGRPSGPALWGRAGNGLEMFLLAHRELSTSHERDQLMFLFGNRKYLQALQSGLTEKQEKTDIAWREIDADLREHPAYAITRNLLPSIHNIVLQERECLTKSRMARIALRVEGYRLEHQKLPSNLAELSPGFELPAPSYPSTHWTYESRPSGFVVGLKFNGADGKKFFRSFEVRRD